MGARFLVVSPTVVIVASVLFAAATGCVATVEERPARIYMTAMPPPPLAEAPPARPAATHVWVEGYWHWNGVQYLWIPGHWERPPAGHIWIAPRYMTSEGRYVYQPGVWHAPGSARAFAR